MTNPLRIVRTLQSRIGVLSVLLGAALTGLPAQAGDVFEDQLKAEAQGEAISAVVAGESPGSTARTLQTASELVDASLQEPFLGDPWPAAQLAIVIDDLGYDRRRGLEAIALPGRLTVAVIPHTPNARFLANTAHDAGREIILHHPMQGSGFRHKASSPKGILTLDMGPSDIRYALRQALTSVPHCIGINNHTGSTLTQARSNMYWLMQQVASTDLYYLDSRTTALTVAGEAAQAWGVPFVSRDVFLDHHDDRESIARQFKYAVKLAKRRGYAVLIAHPRPLSLELLAQQLPTLDPNEIELVHASELIGMRDRLNPGTTAAGQ